AETKIDDAGVVVDMKWTKCSSGQELALNCIIEEDGSPRAILHPSIPQDHIVDFFCRHSPVYD
ncbi:unnamed protein product, partial [Amoebophrya sp. A25]